MFLLKRYRVRIREVIVTDVFVEAAAACAAQEIVRDRWKSGEYEQKLIESRSVSFKPTLMRKKLEVR
jgi:hypothetical protein